MARSNTALCLALLGVVLACATAAKADLYIAFCSSSGENLPYKQTPESAQGWSCPSGNEAMPLPQTADNLEAMMKVVSWSWGIENAITDPAFGEGRASFNDVSIMGVGNVPAELLMAVAAGTRYSTVMLLETAGAPGSLSPTGAWQFKNAVPTSVKHDYSAESGPSYSLSLAATAVVYQPLNSAPPQASGNSRACWDASKNQSC